MIAIQRLLNKLGAQWLTVFFVGAMSVQVLAATSVAGVSGAVTQGGTVVVSGSSFGTNPLGVEWTGAAIESGSPGALFSKAGWSGASDWSPVVYASDIAHSGRQSLKTVVDPSNNWNGLITYALANPVAPSGTLYVSWWARYLGPTNGQWKMLRVSQANTIVDGSMQLTLFNWMQGSPTLSVVPGDTSPDTASVSYYPGGNLFVAQGGTWFRQEVIISASSVNTANGQVQFTRYGGGALNSYTTPSLETHSTSGNNYSYVLFQNYFGNGISGSPTVWLDDIYISNTRARVEVCDTPTWTTRTHCEVQVPTAWSSTQITITTNPGSFGNGTAYLYVLDGSSNVNASGYPVTIGSGGTGGTPGPPAAPTNLHVTP